MSRVFVGMRAIARDLLLIIALATAADAPPTLPKSAASRKPASRPVLKRGGVLSAADAAASAALADAKAEEPAVVIADGDATDAAPPPEPVRSGGWIPGGPVVQQLVLLAVLVLVRVGLALWKSHFKGRALPFASALESVPLLGNALRLVQQAQAKFAELARSPQGAPVMMVLLIIATKLVARADARAMDAEAAAAEKPSVEEVTNAENAAEREADAGAEVGGANVLLPDAEQEAEDEGEGEGEDEADPYE